MNEHSQFVPSEILGETLETSSLRAEKPAPSINLSLLKQIQGIGNLPSELFRRRYESFDKPDRPMQIEPLPFKAALEVANVLIKDDEQDHSEPQELEIKSMLESLISNLDNASPSHSISRITKWAARDPKMRTPNIEKQLALHFQKGGRINMTLLAFLAELNAHKTDFAIDCDLVKSLEENHSFPSRLKDQIAVLDRLDKTEASFLLHKILDFIKNYIITAQNTFDFEISGNGFFLEFQKLAKLEMEYSQNYLKKENGSS